MEREAQSIARCRARIAAASRFAVLTGAGVSAESGVPTFRGADGLWRRWRAEDLATPGAFARDPRLVWEWYDWRRGLIAPLAPNPAHRAIAALEQRIEDFTLITQNVDGLHARAGSARLLEIHGNLWRIRCTGCAALREDRTVPLPELPPRCARCGALERPHVVWFGESLDPEVLGRAAEALARAEIFLVVGTSGVVQPAGSFAAAARRAGAYVVEVNVEPTPTSAVADLTLLGKAGEVLPALVE